MSETLRLGVFSPSPVFEVARTTGILDESGVKVETVPCTSSGEQFGDLLDGRLHAVLTSPDNVLAYRDAEASPLGRSGDVRILAAVDRGLGLSLFTRPGLDLATTQERPVLGVDVPSSGFAFVAYELLARLGLRAHRDYEVLALGSTPRRAQALLAGTCSVTVLNAGNDLRAEESGATRLARAVTLGSYIGTVLAAKASTIDRRIELLHRLVDLMLQTADALANGALEGPAREFASAALGLGPDGVERYLDALRSPDEGLVRGGHVDADSLATLCWLRRRHGPTQGSADEGPALLDDRFVAPR
jgi:ABC transporter, phosphonate, periplasmic substrate-binding protein